MPLLTGVPRAERKCGFYSRFHDRDTTVRTVPSARPADLLNQPKKAIWPTAINAQATQLFLDLEDGKRLIQGKLSGDPPAKLRHQVIPSRRQVGVHSPEFPRREQPRVCHNKFGQPVVHDLVGLRAGRVPGLLLPERLQIILTGIGMVAHGPRSDIAPGLIIEPGIRAHEPGIDQCTEEHKLQFVHSGGRVLAVMERLRGNEA